MPEVFVDADACPVKDEIYRVAERYRFPVRVVCNQHIRTPRADWIVLQVVGNDVDAADDWIAAHAATGDVVVTADLPLAGRCLTNGARVLDPRGEEFREETIGELLATRDIMNHLRDLGETTGGPKPFSARDRGKFLQRLDTVLLALRRAHPLPPPDDESDVDGGHPDQPADGS